MSNDNSVWQGQGSGGDAGSQSRYYDRYWQASGEAVPSQAGGAPTTPTKQVPGGGGGRRGVLVAIIAVVVAVAVVATVVILKVAGGGGGKPVDAAATGSGPVKPTPSASSTPQLSWTNPDVVPTGVRPLKVGWLAVLAEKRLAAAAYDVPKKNWTNEGHTTMGFADSEGKPLIATGDSSIYREGFCKTDKNANMAFVGFHGVGQSDPATAAPGTAKKFAEAISLKKDNKTRAPIGKMSTKQTAVQGLPAVESIVVVDAGDPDKKNCDANKVEVRTMGVSMGSKTTMLVLVRAIGMPNALPEKEAEAILRTVRPAAN